MRARQVLPGSSYMFVRRIDGGRFFLTPTPFVRNAIAYLAIHYAGRHGLSLTTLLAMSTHHHVMADDPLGAYPDFLRDFHMRLTEVLNDHFGHDGPLWENATPGVTLMLDDDATIRESVYCAVNPVAAGIVPASRLWPGHIFSPEDIGTTITATCPPCLADKYDSFPPTVSYRVRKPLAYAGFSDEEARCHFRSARRRAEHQLQVQRGARPWLGVKRALDLGPEHEAPPLPRTTCPPFASKNPETRKAAWARYDDFIRRYNRARTLSRDTNSRDVVWPHGTFAMTQWHKCPRAGP